MSIFFNFIVFSIPKTINILNHFHYLPYAWKFSQDVYSASHLTIFTILIREWRPAAANLYCMYVYTFLHFYFRDRPLIHEIRENKVLRKFVHILFTIMYNGITPSITMHSVHTRYSCCSVSLGTYKEDVVTRSTKLFAGHYKACTYYVHCHVHAFNNIMHGRRRHSGWSGFGRTNISKGILYKSLYFGKVYITEKENSVQKYL